MNPDKSTFSIERHDKSNDKSLRAWSAVDELILEAFDSLEQKPDRTVIYHDRFGYLGCRLHAFSPALILTQKSQEQAIALNLQGLKLTPLETSDPLSELAIPMNLAIVKIPKSLDLFELFLQHISKNSTDDMTVICGFMTRHFSSRMLQIAGEYFDGVEQSKAKKKARLIYLTRKKSTPNKETIRSLTYKEREYKQYVGVFSGDHIDYATQFFLEHIEIRNTEQCILDLGSGNGIIGAEIASRNPNAEIHLLDDTYLAVESAKMNVSGEKIHHHWNHDLSIFEEQTFDVIVTNPPFHFEYELNIHIPISLFKESQRCLKTGGNLQLVASKHLNYKVHLAPLFSTVLIVAEDKKFVVYKCIK